MQALAVLAGHSQSVPVPPSPSFWGALDLFTHWGRNYVEQEQRVSSPLRTLQSLLSFFKANSFLPEHLPYSMGELFRSFKS